jgi:hypothetical protein
MVIPLFAGPIKTQRVALENVLSHIESVVQRTIPMEYVCEAPRLVTQAQKMFQECVCSNVGGLDAENTVSEEDLHNLCAEMVGPFLKKRYQTEFFRKQKNNSLSISLAYGEMRDVMMPVICASHNIAWQQGFVDEAWKILRSYVNTGDNTVSIKDLELVCEKAVANGSSKKDTAVTRDRSNLCRAASIEDVENVYEDSLARSRGKKGSFTFSAKEYEDGLSSIEMASLTDEYERCRKRGFSTLPTIPEGTLCEVNTSPVSFGDDSSQRFLDKKSFSFSKEPAKLDELAPGEFHQIRSFQQTDAECGCYVKYNALVINNVLENGEALSQQIIEEGVSVFVESLGTANWVNEMVVFSDLATALSGQNVYMLKVERDGNVRPAGSALDINSLSMDDFWSSVREETTKNEGYFVVNFDNHHWVLVVAIKQPGKKGPVFLYLDSMNTPIDENLRVGNLKPYFESLAIGDDVL